MDIVKAFHANDLHTNITIKGTFEDPLFRANDIGLILEIKNIHTTIKDFDSVEKELHTMDTLGGNQNVLFLTEVGLYRLLGMSRKPIARDFQRWVAKVIKEIRLTNKYELEKQLIEKDKIIEDKDEIIKETKNKLGEKDEIIEETQNKLNIFIEYDEELFWNENQIDDYNNKNVIYVAFIGIFDNERIYKYGKSEQIYTREFKHHQNFFDIFKMRFVIECDNMSFVEKYSKNIYFILNIVSKKLNNF